tara:strand:+ start:118 stop:1068 length:951 start_codon:yes stop_codon:yes gene_type:complete
MLIMSLVTIAFLHQPIRPMAGRSRPTASVLMVASEGDPYDLLGVDAGASASELRKAFRQRARTLHPDVSDAPDAAVQFRRLVSAFETLLERAMNPKAAAPRTRSTDGEEEAWGRNGESASSRPAGSRREAEATGREASEKRRRLWRKTWFEEIFREHMPLGFSPVSQQRTAFVDSLERVVQSFAGRCGADSAAPEGEADDLEEVLRESTNREVLDAELKDLRLACSLHRQRLRALDEQIEQADARAAIWRGAAPSSQADRLNAMQRELDFLDQASRLRERRAAQRASYERLDAQQLLARKRLEELRGARYTAPGAG